MRGRATGGALAALALFGLLFPLMSGRSLQAVVGGIQQRVAATFEDESFSERSEENRQAVRIFGRHPLTGGGFGAAAYIEGYPQRVPSLFHNVYAGLLAKTGVIGLVAFLVPLGYLVSRGVRFGRPDDPAAQVTKIATSWLLGLLLAAAATPFLLNPVGLLIVAITAGLVGDRMAAASPRPADIVIGRAPGPVDRPTELSPSRSR